ncbi:tRNA epoxyqueuosine(34) reductase QueG [Pseudomarimonas salicorniae]|uniref:Epoxyqueuosine reductase n=1 Tax=Pseudomarimonas salicorniae TaxID=2933270 RepID=A0ABT0GN60_9GAMM|nr:tRNA epoxyqueuosine(34) reductase QueG [Lysobacter sp. CAU 1642]MCK7595437.1 tRNA epoxyqueuosine(34) reductase QueG [Lysobacter sp. CAU 1642]
MPRFYWPMSPETDAPGAALADPGALVEALRAAAAELGFQALGISGIELAEDERRLLDWLQRGYHGEMDYMARHGTRRARPAELVPGTLRVISARMDYWPEAAREPWSVIDDGTLGYVSRYALGRDYHKVLRQRLQKLCDWLAERVGEFGYRVFTDSAPVLEKPLARNAGLGWIGKHSNLIDRRSGSYFFLGEIYTDLALPVDAAASDHCGTCTRCLSACPTGAIVAPYQVDARRCISYLTIEHPGSIPEPLRAPMGNRIYGCDDCQLVCPWNKFTRPAALVDFEVRHGLDAPQLIDLFSWDEETFLARTEGSAIRRIGWERWLRNIAVALGNAPRSESVVAALVSRRDHPSPVVREHVDWALSRQAGHD